MTYAVQTGTVYIVGAGPGAADLITVRGRDIIVQADLVLYADSLVQESVAQLARKPTARIVGSAGLDLEQQIALMADAARNDQVVARVHTGDPALYGAIHEQIVQLADQDIPTEIVPGVTAAFAAAARLGVELTIPELVQTLIISRVAGRTPVPEREALDRLAAHGASLALYLSIAQIAQVAATLIAGGGYTSDTPVAVVYRATWPDEQIIRGTLAGIAEQVQAAGISRHALVLVSPALAVHAPSLRSRLYDAGFAHGYRRKEPGNQGTDEPGEPGAPESCQIPPDPCGNEPAGIAIVAVTRNGSRLAARLAAEMKAIAVVPERFAAEAAGAESYSGPVIAEIRRRWSQHNRLVLIMASGVAIRALAPLLRHKANDPAVVCLDEAGRSVIPLLGGHQAGANALARRIATITGGHAAITTASDVQALPALDTLGSEQGWRIDPDSALTHASACLVNGDPIGIFVDPALPAIREQLDGWFAGAEQVTFVDSVAALAEPHYAAGLLVNHRLPDATERELLHTSVRYYPPVLLAGLGSRRNVALAELRAALATTLAEAGLAPECLAALATAEVKADEPAMQQLAAELNLPLRIVAGAELAALPADGFSPSAAGEHLGLPGVAEPCAVLAAGGDPAALLLPKRSFASCTVAIALRQPAPAPGRLTLVSLGPGDPRQMTLAAHDALRQADIVLGYQSYIEQVRPLLAPQQELIALPMRSERERAARAIELARAGKRVALISSGDVGIYAMAGPVFEALQQHNWPGNDPDVLVLPGVSAFQSAAARLGAAISHDLCVISLSDLLTPWELIEQRLHAAAAGDFVVALYNPRSAGRDWQLNRALAILREQRPPATPVALCRNVSRPDEQLLLSSLAEVDPAQADMLTVVLVGNRQSSRHGDHFITPRGYTRSPAASPPEATGIPPAETYPINLTRLAGAPVLVVGGGAVGERKVDGLLAVAAQVTLVSPQATPQLREWAGAGRMRWQQREYQPGDLAGQLLVFAATNQRETNARIARAAELQGCLCNVADAPAEGNFHLPAVYRENGMTVAVSSEGANPRRARRLRDRLAALLRQEDAPDER
jgi:cobalt-precorrin 5A hydrolase / precorrin-3B C17-methyltransferase